MSSEVVLEIEESTEQTEERLQMPQTWTTFSKLSCVKIKQGSHQRAQRKRVKTWKFKFKRWSISQREKRWLERMEEGCREAVVQCVSEFLVS